MRRERESECERGERVSDRDMVQDGERRAWDIFSSALMHALQSAEVTCSHEKLLLGEQI